MMRLAALLAISACAGCATTNLQAPAAQVYHSNKPRDALADCLMDRLASGDFRVHREAAGEAINVRVTGVAGTYFLFTLRDSPDGGTVAEMRRMNSVAPGLHNAETCFSA